MSTANTFASGVHFDFADLNPFSAPTVLSQVAIFENGDLFLRFTGPRSHFLCQFAEGSFLEPRQGIVLSQDGSAVPCGSYRARALDLLLVIDSHHKPQTAVRLRSVFDFETAAKIAQASRDNLPHFLHGLTVMG